MRRKKKEFNHSTRLQLEEKAGGTRHCLCSKDVIASNTLLQSNLYNAILGQTVKVKLCALLK